MESLVTWCDDKHQKLRIKEKAEELVADYGATEAAGLKKHSVHVTTRKENCAAQRCQKAMYSNMLPS